MKTIKATKTVLPMRLTQKQRLQDLKRIVQTCFTLLNSTDFKEISNLTLLSLPTIYKLHKGKNITLAVRFGTIQALCAAAGLKVVTTPFGMDVRLVK